jgi:hypothetical protein
MRQRTSVGLALLGALFAACGFRPLPAVSHDAGVDVAGPDPEDAAPDAVHDSAPSVGLCFGTGIVHVCLASPATSALMISKRAGIDTDDPTTCAAITSSDDYCVIAATAITIQATLRATGSRPLVLVASDSIAITASPAGVVDVASHRGADMGAGAERGACSSGVAATSVDRVGGGGAGGSFIGSGGDGGASGNGGVGGRSAAAVASVTALRGGCPGQDGAGAHGGVKGHGGGAVFLIAGNTIDMKGTINASGGGGGGGDVGSADPSGGGGGGAGGMIGFDAPTILAGGLVLASGGGGGQGSIDIAEGGPGADPDSPTAARGGTAGPGNSIGANGGNGSSNAVMADGVDGRDAQFSGVGGGGGGGGAGLVKVPAGVDLGPNASPPPSP